MLHILCLLFDNLNFVFLAAIFEILACFTMIVLPQDPIQYKTPLILSLLIKKNASVKVELYYIRLSKDLNQNTEVFLKVHYLTQGRVNFGEIML